MQMSKLLLHLLVRLAHLVMLGLPTTLLMVMLGLPTTPYGEACPPLTVCDPVPEGDASPLVVGNNTL